MDCYDCKAKEYCLAAVERGSIMCTMNLLRYGGTHGDAQPKKQDGMFCQYCGKPLRVIGQERFCNNPRCTNRFVSV